MRLWTIVSPLFARWVLAVPMLGNVAPGAEPDPVVPARIVEEPDQPDRAARPSNQPVVQRNAHDLRPFRSLLVEQVEAIGHVLRELVGGTEA